MIIGASQAGIGAATELRRLGFKGSVTVLGDEPHLPYQRPPLSKDLLYEKGTAPNLYFYPQDFYTEQSINLELGRKAVAIDRGAQTVSLETGGSIAYDHLLIATGSRPRPLDIAGLEDAITLRSLDDAWALARSSVDWRNIAIIGGGFIGLEVASFLISQGKDVTVIESGPQLMGRVVSRATADHFHAHHTAQGTRILVSHTVTAGNHSAGRWTLHLSDGNTLEADMVISAVGALANSEIARVCGIAVGRGILVDDLMLSSDPAISAIGDCAEHVDPVHNCRVRLESVQNAVDQGKTFAARIMGRPQPYASTPWFWSTQGSAKLQIAGLALGKTDDIVRPDASGSGQLSVFRYIGEQLAAIETVNRPAEHLLARRLLGNHIVVPKGAAADPSFNLRALL